MKPSFKILTANAVQSTSARCAPRTLKHARASSRSGRNQAATEREPIQTLDPRGKQPKTDPFSTQASVGGLVELRPVLGVTAISLLHDARKPSRSAFGHFEKKPFKKHLIYERRLRG